MSKYMNIKILFFNCRGLGEDKKRIDVFNYLKSLKCNIYCLQDVHFLENMQNKTKSQWEGNVIFNSNNSNSRGVCILFNDNFEYKILQEKRDQKHHLLALDLLIEGNKMTLVNIYGPNTDNPNFYDSLLEIINSFSNNNNILCGDFNIVQNMALDSYNYKSINNPKARDKLLNIINFLNLTDPFREIYPDKIRYTWRRPRPLQQSRLDYFLISKNFMNNVENQEILPGYRSDHSIIILSLKFNNFIKGKGLWKFNANLLHDIEYVKKIKACIKRIIKQYMVPVYNIENIDSVPLNKIQFVITDQLFFETLLMEIRGQSISYASFKKKTRHIERKQIK